MKSVVRWTEVIPWRLNRAGKLTSIYSEVAPSPMEMVLQAHAACSLIDLRVGLKDRMENVRAMWVDVDGVRADQSPRVFTSVKMHYVVEGDVPESWFEE